MKQDREILMYGHGGSGNRGCEAIVRSTSALLKQACGRDTFIRVSSGAPQEDIQAGLPDVDAVMDSGSRWPALSMVRWARAALWRLMRSPSQRYILSNLRTLRWAGRADLCLAVGGDNYCYDPVEMHYALNRILRRRVRRMVFWGCSIEPERLDRAMRKDLCNFDLITARESITFAALREHRVENVQLFPDPAFTLVGERLPLPAGWREGNMVGVNLSPLIERYEQRSGGALEAFAKLIRHILSHTDYGVVLIPHVLWPSSDDRQPLGQLEREFRSEGRVMLLPDRLTASQTKGYISRCRYFVGARTHATIAAYSSGVPTLVLGYSVKARGIARDLFGSEKGLVLPVQDLENPHQLVTLFDGVQEREKELRSCLADQLPKIQSQAAQSARAVARLLDTGDINP